ncbi:unnamed protein product [Eruca vesicaria subsp. sativa]|uniref:Uncharacterized protein n=1 Tax=Eruca vesicaria subsp. sativa TaxID=29727 RepID=A0ABC8K7W7_ERUVS|nr:unnamed protein product [Eruca vesicaria subsp. sativa]
MNVKKGNDQMSLDMPLIDEKSTLMQGSVSVNSLLKLRKFNSNRYWILHARSLPFFF